MTHSDEHRHRIDVRGNADTGVEVWRRDDDGAWFLWKRELSPGVTEKD